MHQLHHQFTTIWITEVIAAEIGLCAIDPAPHEFPVYLSDNLVAAVLEQAGKTDAADPAQES